MKLFLVKMQVRGLELNLQKDFFAVASCKFWENFQKARKSYPEEFCKKSVVKNFAKFIGEQLCWSLLFNKVEDWRPATLFKKDSNAGVFL